MSEILIAEDDPHIRELIADLLTCEDYTVRTCDNGVDVLTAIKLHRPDLLVLDIMMPKMDGFTVCSEIRKTDKLLPIIMLTARTDLTDRIQGLIKGANDYVLKPFEVLELLARIKAQLRQAANYQAQLEPSKTESISTIFPFGPYQVDTECFMLRDSTGYEENLTRREIAILRYFADNAGKVVTRSTLWEEFWPDDIATIRVVDMLIVNLRRKLKTSGNLIETIHGEGYRYKGFGEHKS